ncbi:MAG: FG-GAP-like repeat-containing protein, partial [Phycisphaerales bacterium]|nr:FG-GAP-like repeat-containing protein [Phycisphaerales bacterium]
MPKHRTPDALFIPVLLAGAACAGSATAQVTFDFTDSGQTLGNGSSVTVALGDLDGDGDLDAMVGNYNQPNTVWTNDGSGTFTNSGQALGSSESTSVALGDLDGDGDLDAMVANFNSPNTVWTNDGSGSFTDSGQALGNSNSRSVALGDLDGDGDLDAMVGNWNEPNTVWTNNGSGTFTDSGQALGSSESFSVALGDLDGDGDLDAMVVNWNEPNTVWTNDGSGTFTNSGQALGNSGSWSVALGDLDGDGDLDAMVGNYNAQANTVWTNDGSGTFTNSGQTLGNGRSRSVALGDLDGDGDLDAMVGNAGNQPNTVWTNDGTGSFTDSGQALGNRWSQSVALGDLDGDGDLDAMVANEGQANTVWTNDPSNISAVYNRNSSTWFESAKQAVAAASADDTLLIGGASFDVPGIIDARDLPLTFEARSDVTITDDLMFLPGNGSSFISLDGDALNTYASRGRIIAPENGQLIFNDLEFLDGSQFQQNGSSLLVNGQLATTGGVTYLSGEALAVGISTGINGVNRVADDTDIYGDYTNAGATIIQRGILYIYGDLVNTGTLTGEYNNGFAGGSTPEPGDGFSIGGSYTVGQDATLSMPNPVWWLRVGGDLDIAVDDPADFTMSEATIELNGLAPGNLQTMETLSADLGADEAGFDP